MNRQKYKGILEEINMGLNEVNTEPFPPVDLPGLDIAELAETYVEVVALYKRLDEVTKSWGKLKDEISKSTIPNKLDELGLDKVQIPSIGKSVYPLTKYSASIINDDMDPDNPKGKGFQWLQDNGGDELIKETVNAQTLTSFLRHRIEEEGIDPPDEIFNFNSYRITGMSSYTPK